MYTSSVSAEVEITMIPANSTLSDLSTELQTYNNAQSSTQHTLSEVVALALLMRLLQKK